MRKEELIVPVEKLRFICNPKDFKFRDTSGVKPAHGFIGQEKAVEALRFGLEIQNREYNIVVTGNTGRGKKKEVLCEFTEEFAKKKSASAAPALKDICYVYNFEKPEQPRIIFFEKGGGAEFLQKMAMIFKKMQSKKRAEPEDIKEVRSSYAYSEQVLDYLRKLQDYIAMSGEKISPLPFIVNLFVDNASKTAPPVIFEGNPSFHNLFGEIEKEFVMGGCVTDHIHLRAGSLALANGGYLILNMSDILENYGVWQKLKKTLRQSALKIEEPFNAFVGSLNPEPIPLNVKVIIIAEPDIYSLLVKYDPDFLTLFKVKVELDSEMPITQENKESYAGFVSARCKKDNLLPLNSGAVAKIVEHGARLADNQNVLTTKLDEVKDLIIESSYCAAKSHALTVKASHVKEALRFWESRFNLAAQKSQDTISDGTFLIDTKGEKIGQINSIVIYDYGDFSFGLPHRITAKTFAGDQGVISIQREVKNSGPVHDTGVLTLKGYFGDEYGKRWPISFSASISFEQCYHGVDGDSASAAELFCLISSLADLPISQSFAVTGSINQHGEIQPIGGVNKKIEGFFEACKRRGLNGGHGVIIPHQNIQNLMLKEDVVRACKKGKFRIYAIKTVDEGIEILMDRSADDVRKKVKERLIEMAPKNKK